MEVQYEGNYSVSVIKDSVLYISITIIEEM